MSNDTSTGAPVTEPVSDWATDYDIFDPQYVSDPYGIWNELRGSACPMAHSDRWGGSWLPTSYADVYAIAHDIDTFPSGNGIAVVPMIPNPDGPPAGASDGPLLASGVPPISADPPLHSWTRRLVLPTMSPQRVAEYEVFTRELCERLADEILARGSGDAATEYAQQIPVRVIGHILGVPEIDWPTRSPSGCATSWSSPTTRSAASAACSASCSTCTGDRRRARPNRRTTSSPSSCTPRRRCSRSPERTS